MRNLIIAISLIVSTACIAQNSEQKIIEVYGQTYFNELNQNNPAVITYLEDFANNGIELQSYNAKYSDAKMLIDIPLRSKTGEVISIQQFLSEYNSPNFNPLKYGFNSSKDVQVYRLSGDSRVLVIYSLTQIKK